MGKKLVFSKEVLASCPRFTRVMVNTNMGLHITALQVL